LGGLSLYNGIQKNLNKNEKKFNVKIFERDTDPQGTSNQYHNYLQLNLILINIFLISSMARTLYHHKSSWSKIVNLFSSGFTRCSSSRSYTKSKPRKRITRIVN